MEVFPRVYTPRRFYPLFGYSMPTFHPPVKGLADADNDEHDAE
jgi:hypothetical protein